MIFETIGVMASFANKTMETDNIVITGNISQIPYGKIVLKKIEKLHNVNFIIPNYAAYATIIGAIIIATEVTKE